MALEPGTLYVVGTPIGNLDDISTRARKVLEDVELVAAEDTRRARKLLSALGLRNELLSLHEHNEAQRSDELLDRLAAGQSIALISDAGTPLVSDPGYRLLAGARDRGLPVSPVPGSCAAIAALSIAGLPSDRFRFEGFLPSRSAARRRRLSALKRAPETLIFYEAVHRIDGALADMATILGGDRPVAVARELTKLHETLYRGSLEQVRSALHADPGGAKGEFTVVVGGDREAAAGEAELERVAAVLLHELPLAQAARLTARLTGARRQQAYAVLARLKTGTASAGDD